MLRNPFFAIAPVALVFSTVMAAREGTWMAAVPLTVGLFVCLLHLSVDVDSAVRLRFLPFARTVSFEDIQWAEVIEYRWLTYGGWGIRLAKGVTAWSVWGKQAVKLHLEGRDLVIQTQRPDELLAELAAAGVALQPRASTT